MTAKRFDVVLCAGRILFWLLCEAGYIVFLWYAGFTMIFFLPLIPTTFVVVIKVWCAVDDLDSAREACFRCPTCGQNGGLTPVLGSGSHLTLCYWQCMCGKRYVYRTRRVFQIFDDGTVRLVARRRFFRRTWQPVTRPNSSEGVQRGHSNV